MNAFNPRRRPAGDVVLVDRPPGDVVLRRVTLSDRLRSRLRVGALDRALAAGAVPDSDVALTLHASRLIALDTRRSLARVLHGIAEATRPPHLPARWSGNQAARAGNALVELAARLRHPEAVDARGVALVRVLLSDGGGPLHVNHGADVLVHAARRATAALEPA